MKSGWVTKKLGDVCEILDSRRIPITRKDRKPGNIPYYGATGQVDSVADYIFDERLLLLGEDGADWSAGANSAYIIEGKSWVNNHAHVLRPLDIVSDCWLMYYLNATDLNRWISGTTVPKLNQGNMCEIPIPIPPLAEQKRIVAKIDAAFEKIDALKANAEKNLANAKELFQSALDEAMRPKKGWVEKRLGEVANIRVGPFGSSLHKADYVENGVPLVNPCHMKDSKIADRISTQVSHDKAESLKEYRLKAGDIVFARRGEIGRLAFVSEKEDGYLCGTGSLFARFRERYDIQFLYFFFSSKSFVEKLEMLSTGTTMKSINSSALESMCFSVPPMNEQRRLAKQLDSLSQKTETLQQNYSQQISDCAEMRQAILREAFEGRL